MEKDQFLTNSPFQTHKQSPWWSYCFLKRIKFWTNNSTKLSYCLFCFFFWENLAQEKLLLFCWSENHFNPIKKDKFSKIPSVINYLLPWSFIIFLNEIHFCRHLSLQSFIIQPHVHHFCLFHWKHSVTSMRFNTSRSSC